MGGKTLIRKMWIKRRVFLLNPSLTGLAPGATSEVCVPGTSSETGELCPASIDCVLHRYS